MVKKKVNDNDKKESKDIREDSDDLIKKAIGKKIKSAKIEKPLASDFSKGKVFSEIKKLKPLKWTSEMSVGEAKIDEQHQTLLNQINKLIENLSKGWEMQTIRDTLGFLDKYVKEHFTYEEDYQAKIKYPKLEEHKKIHASFVEFYKKFKQEFEAENRETKSPTDSARKFMEKAHKFLGEWLVNHIMGDDHDFCVFSGKCKDSVEKVEKPSAPADKPSSEGIDIASIAAEIKGSQIKKQREPISEVVPSGKLKGKKAPKTDSIMTEVPGFDELLDSGIPKGNAMIVAGGAGSGKTIFCMQTLINKANEGKKCLMMTLEERESKLIKHMEDFGWPASDQVNSLRS